MADYLDDDGVPLGGWEPITVVEFVEMKSQLPEGWLRARAAAGDTEPPSESAKRLATYGMLGAALPPAAAGGPDA